jgi:hypothetical protein
MRAQAIWANRTAAIVSIAISTGAVLAAVLAAYVGNVDAFFHDAWLYTNPAEYLPTLFVRHNDHPFAIGRLAFALDYWLGDAGGWLILSATFASLLWTIAAALRLGRTAGFVSTRQQIVLSPLIAAVILSAQGYASLTQAFQFSFVLAFASSAAAFAALAAYAADKRASLLCASALYAFIASQSLANGALTPLLVLLLAIRLDLPRRIVFAFAALTALCWLLLALMPRTSPPAEILLGHWIDMAIYALRVLGNILALALQALTGLDPMSSSPIFGALIAVLAITLGAFHVFARERNPGALGATALAAFAVASALLIGMSRFFMGAGSALASRYAIIGGVAIAALVIMIAAFAAKERPYLARVAATFAAAVAVLLCIASFQVLPQTREQHIAAVGVQASLATGEGSHLTRSSVMSDPEFSRRIQNLSDAHKWLFTDLWTHRLGQSVTVPETARATCAASAQWRAARTQGLVRATGTVDVFPARGTTIVALDESNVMQGYGRVLREPADLLLLPALRPKTADWVARVRASTLEEARGLRIYLASSQQLICRLNRRAQS